jgi:hypothetical protein
MKEGLDRRGKTDLPLLLDDASFAAAVQANEANFAPSRNSTVNMLDATTATLREAEAMGNQSVDPAVFERIETTRREAIKKAEKSETSRRDHDFGDEHTEGTFRDLMHNE